MNNDLIIKAKKFARKRGKSLSRLVSEYFKYLLPMKIQINLHYPHLSNLGMVRYLTVR